MYAAWGAVLDITICCYGAPLWHYDYGVKHWDIAAAYAICEAVGMDVRFIEIAISIKSFHTNAESCPYYAGDATFMQEVDRLKMLKGLKE